MHPFIVLVNNNVDNDLLAPTNFFYKQHVNVFTNNDIKYVFINIIGRGENTLWMGQLGQFHYMCVNYTPTTCVALILGFIFGVWVLYFDFHKVNTI